MKPSVYIGQNIGSLNFNKFITLKKYGNKSVINASKLAEAFFEESISMDEMSYNIERNDDNQLHIHILGKASNDINIIEEIKSFIKPVRMEQVSRRQIIKTKHNINVDSFQDKWVTINGVNFTGKKYSLYLENIIQKYNAAVYSNKYNDYGLANNYLKK